MNPPIRTEKERKDLWSVWERIDVIASDHAPHTRTDKEQPFAAAPSGIPGVETMVPLLLAEVLNRKISLHDVIRKTSANPSALLGIPRPDFRQETAGISPYTQKMLPRSTRTSCTASAAGHRLKGCRRSSPALWSWGGRSCTEEGEFSPDNPSWLAGKGFFPP